MVPPPRLVNGHRAIALNAMQSSLNKSKQAPGPEQWMPPTSRCRYIEVWTAVKHRWSRIVDQAERDALIDDADACADNRITVPRTRLASSGDLAEPHSHQGRAGHAHHALLPPPVSDDEEQ